MTFSVRRVERVSIFSINPLSNTEAYHGDMLLAKLTVLFVWLKQYARSDWLLSGQDFLAMTEHYENFSWLDGSSELLVKATSALAKTTKIWTKYNYIFNN